MFYKGFFDPLFMPSKYPRRSIFSIALLFAKLASSLSEHFVRASRAENFSALARMVAPDVCLSIASKLFLIVVVSSRNRPDVFTL